MKHIARTQLHLQHQYINSIFRISAFLSQVLFYLKLCIDSQNSTENGLKCPKNNCKLGLASRGPRRLGLACNVEMHVVYFLIVGWTATSSFSAGHGPVVTATREEWLFAVVNNKQCVDVEVFFPVFGSLRDTDADDFHNLISFYAKIGPTSLVRFS